MAGRPTNRSAQIRKVSRLAATAGDVTGTVLPLRHSGAPKRSAGEPGIQQLDSGFSIIGLLPMISPRNDHAYRSNLGNDELSDFAAVASKLFRPIQGAIGTFEDRVSLVSRRIDLGQSGTDGEFDFRGLGRNFRLADPGQ